MRAEGIAWITGASRGIGRARALVLARRGVEGVASMRRPADGAALAGEAAREGLRLRVEALDVRRPQDWEPPAGLRVLVNNAGLEGPQLPVEHTPEATWREIFETNVFGPIELIRRAIPALRASGGGVVCNLGTASQLVPMPLFAPYRASKAAVSTLGESLRTELAPFGIRLLEVLPGAIQTDMLRRSEHLPEAAQFPAYRELAERVDRARRGAASASTPAASVAARIADAILDDGAPLRMAPDPMGEALLAAWRGQDDEAAMGPLLRLFGEPEPE
jgi:NAD(P)-dependent dehydrogenase (short-subunit alcohol dehydrogenase family)